MLMEILLNAISSGCINLLTAMPPIYRDHVRVYRCAINNVMTGLSKILLREAFSSYQV
jgi:hypothetical protein